MRGFLVGVVLVASIGLAAAQDQPECQIPEDYRAHDSDCTRFTRCDHGVRIEYACADGFVWEPRGRFCRQPITDNLLDDPTCRRK